MLQNKHLRYETLHLRYKTFLDRSTFIGMSPSTFFNQKFSKMNRYFLACRIYNFVAVKNNPLKQFELKAPLQ